MVIGLLYDCKEDFNLFDDSYCDFSYKGEAENIKNELEKLGHKVIDIGHMKNFVDLVINKKLMVDLVFNMIEGYMSRNREGLVPGICEALGIKFVGTDSFGLSLSLHKFHTNLLVQSMGINIPKSFLFDFSIHNIEELADYVKKAKIEFPIITKPNHEGSSMGITLVDNLAELKNAIETLYKKYNQEILCQEYIIGEEMSVPMIECKGDIQILGVVGFDKINGERIGIFTTEKKNNNLHLQRPPLQSKMTLDKVKDDSVKAFKILKLKSYCRMDWIVKNDIPYFLEATPLPSFDKGNCFQWCANENNKKFSDVLKQIIENCEV